MKKEELNQALNQCARIFAKGKNKEFFRRIDKLRDNMNKQNKENRPPFLMDDKLKKAAKECAEAIEMEELMMAIHCDEAVEEDFNNLRKHINDNFTPNSEIEKAIKQCKGGGNGRRLLMQLLNKE